MGTRGSEQSTDPLGLRITLKKSKTLLSIRYTQGSQDHHRGLLGYGAYDEMAGRPGQQLLGRGPDVRLASGQLATACGGNDCNGESGCTIDDCRHIAGPGGIYRARPGRTSVVRAWESRGQRPGRGD